MSKRLIPAVRSGDLAKLQFYIKNGANPNYQDNDQESALSYATWENRFDIVSYLVKETDAYVDIEDRRGNTPLLLAIKKGFSKIIILLLARGADLRKEDRHRVTPIKKMIMKNNAEVLQYLVEHQKELGVTEEEMEQIEEWAQEQEDEKILDYLEEHNNDIIETTLPTGPVQAGETATIPTKDQVTIIAIAVSAALLLLLCLFLGIKQLGRQKSKQGEPLSAAFEKLDL